VPKGYFFAAVRRGVSEALPREGAVGRINPS
jgi:hypothetical protein